MFQIVLPLMESKGKGLIINISSFSATCPTPLLAVYGATKTYVDFFSRSMQMEYGPRNITIQSVLPSFVATNMSRIRKPTLMAPRPKDYVAAQMKTVGLEDRTYGYPSHKALGFVFDCIINNLLGPVIISKVVMNNLKGLRKAVYRKMNLKDS